MTLNIKKTSNFSTANSINAIKKGTGGLTKFSKTQVTTIVTNGLVLHLDAGDPASYPGSGTTWIDLSANDNSATLTNGPTYDSANGGRIILDGSDDYAPTAGTIGFPFGSSPGSISAWAKTDTVSGGTHWIFSYGTAGNGLARFVGIFNNTYYFGGYNNDITASGVVVDTWFNICGTYDGTYARLYLNGSLVTGPTSKSWNTTAGDNQVGRQVGGGEYWDGSVAQVLVYNTALSDAEVLQNFNVLKGRFGL